MSADLTHERVKSFRVPDLGEGLEEVTVTCWNVAVGDDVELNQTLCTVETAKAEVEIPSPYAGRIVERDGAEGDVLKVGAVLVRIDTAPSDGAEPSASLNGEAAVPTLVGYGADAAIDASRRSTRPLAAPPVRKLAKDLSVDLASLQRGAGEVITRADVLAAAHASGIGPEVRPVLGVQARMAETMTLSHREIPAAKVSLGVDCTELLRLRDRFRSLAPVPDHEITPFVLTLRLLVIALIHNTILNSTWVDSPEGPHVHIHRGVHLGFGVATRRGLLVPVITDAQNKTTRELASRTAELIAGAREGTLTPAELRGSTFTVSNFGALGVDDGVPVINHPEAAILGIGAIKPRPVAVGDEVVVRPTTTLTCVFDHRVADGAQVAQFICELRDLMQSPETALLDL
ncbi:dihydrolipoamide acetyltransferase family protein [Mycobacterium haemophilum]|uniref:Dihydrolipoamide acetyltransferase component of pyruvate dehydrogenase complex n=1 Tax=Mycobacterium haemophilum TaxID=29311 RepID=A0A0I9YC57_9MYCO|nr:dihydrolipoamide acetyltransferase family protein [Mycobacterium haemophilum]KLO25941.1 branched-chain alpha-keto acid dehydrogenase subunit E2 [Mycobacterium haemophilum]KLO37472.1 branched-chain alpha-keto acid dehydrogenase subunit E2 [Mycobacterium haemophilum]KLO44021.1 branched-chain alpha-keto acid dehydrogenase subunit E2 [Mycobacterium haemophilum]KLO49301.1 branched-chain alpha-keto acid dehydrogenase subunit E2 [Mycobacterium haemophilum]